MLFQKLVNSSSRQVNIYLVIVYRFLLVMLFFTFCRIEFYLFNADHFPQISFTHFIYLLLGGLKFDTAALLYVNTLFLVLMILPFRLRYDAVYQRIVKWIFVITNGIALAWNSADVIYFDFILKRTTASVFKAFEHETNMGNLLFRFVFVDYWYVSLIWLVMLVIIIRFYDFFVPKRPTYEYTWKSFVSGVLLIGLVAFLFVGGVRGGWAHSTRPITLSNAGKYVNNPKEMAIVLNTPFSILRTLSKKTVAEKHYFTDERVEEIYSPLHLPDSVSVFTPQNVVILIIESFGKEYIGNYNKHLDGGNYKGYTPFFDSLMTDSKVFWYSMANGRKSIDALPSVMTSIPSLTEPYVLSHYSTNKVHSLAYHLNRKGYYTSFFHGAPNGSMGFQSYINLAEFDDYYGKNEYDKDADFDGMWGIWDEPYLQHWAAQMNSFKEPFFTSLFSVSSHHPFRVPEKYEGKFPEGPLKIHRCIGYTDNALRQFFKTSSKMPWFENTLFVITADHASVSHYPEYKTNVGYFKIPIVFYHPSDTTLKGVEMDVAQQIDIMPTVLDYMNYDQPYFGYGQNLLDTTNQRFSINYVSGTYQYFEGDYVYQLQEEKAVGLYNFKTDLLLENNLIGTLPKEEETLSRGIKAFIQQYNNRMLKDALTE